MVVWHLEDVLGAHGAAENLGLLTAGIAIECKRMPADRLLLQLGKLPQLLGKLLSIVMGC